MRRPTPPAWLGRLARPLRLAARVALGLVALVLVVVAVVLLLAPARRALLDRGLDLAADALPGELTVARADWPRLGSLALDGVIWTDGADTLARADTLRLDLDLGDLLGRELTIRRVLVAGLAADVPAITAHLAAVADTGMAGTTAPADTAAAPLPVPFLHQGAVPPLPSLAVERLALRRVDILAAADRPVHLDSLTAALDLRRDHDPRLRLGLRGRPLPEVGVAWRLDGGIGADSLVFDLAPLQLAVQETLPPPHALDTPGRLAVSRPWLDDLVRGGDFWPRLVLSGMRVQGAAGRWRLDADLDGRRPGEIRLTSELPVLPLPLMRAVGGGALLPPAVADSLQGRWTEGGVPDLGLTVSIEPPRAPAGPAAGRYAVRGRSHLPPPGTLRPLLPPPLQVQDLGPLDLDLAGRYDGQAEPARWSADLDLGGTAWLDVARLEAHGTPTTARLETLAVELPGLALRASGRAAADSVALDLHLVVPDSTLLQRWQDPALTGLGVELETRVQAAGPLPLPRVEATASARLRTPQATVPRVELAALASPDTLDLRLDLPQGLDAGTQRVDSLRFAFAGAADDSLRWLRGRLRAGVRTPQAALDLASRLRAADLATAPAGTLVTDSLAITLGEQRLSNRRPWQLTLAAAESLLAIRDLDLAGELGNLQLAATASPDSIDADLDLVLDLARDVLVALAPPDLAPLLPPASLTAQGAVKARGRPEAPWARAEMRVGFRDNPDLEPLHLDARLHVGGAGPQPAGLAADHPPWSPRSARAELSLAAADTVLLALSALVPLPYLSTGPDSVAVGVRSDATDLARLDPLLPAGISLEGRLDADARARGVMAPGEQQPDLDLAGSIELSQVRASGPDGSWVAMGGRVDLGGSSRTPEIRGGLTIEGGLIRLPDPPPSLLPASGDAMLWEAGAVDSSGVVVTEPDTSGGESPLPQIVPDLEFAVHAPGGLWLRGQGLDVELAGDLVIDVQDGTPGIEGQLEAVQGTMRQLGHVFRLERGLITFYADAPEPDPHLDLQLGVRVSGYEIEIMLTGTASEPRLAFGSEPPLSDGDIMSLLLFGKTSDELDEGQAGLLADRAGQIALAYGASRLQEAVAREVGLDVVQIGPREDDSETTTLTVGKYLSPRVLVRYEQILDDQSGFYVHLDYRISGPLKLHTQVSQGEESGAEFAWEKDY